MQHRITLLPNGIIEQAYLGDQTRASVEEAVRAIRPFIEKRQSQGQPILILTDLRKLGKSSAGSRRASVESLRTIPFDKVALYGASLFMKHLGNLIIFASGQSARAHMFDTREEALAWLSKH